MHRLRGGSRMTRGRNGSKATGKLVQVFDLESSLPAARQAGRLPAGDPRRQGSLHRPVGSWRDSDRRALVQPGRAGNPAIARRGRGGGRAICRRASANRASASFTRTAERPPGSIRRQLVGAAARCGLSCEPRSSAGLDQLGALRRASRSRWRRRPACRLARTRSAAGGPRPSPPEARYVEPRPGRLVLFPSWMWHGTVPFGAGERLTVAFDVAPPRRA